MNRFLIIPICGAVAAAVAACATPGAEPESSQSVKASQSIQAPRSVQTLESHDSDALADNDADMVAVNDSAQESKGIEELESPEVSETPPSMIPGRLEPEPAVVCERVVPTGSILPTKVCRTREEIERKQRADQEIIDDIKRNTAIFNTRL